MNPKKLLEIIEQGENATVEFKSSAVRPEGIAREIVAFSNTMGGLILIGVEDDGRISGISSHISEEWAANIARNNLMPAISPGISKQDVENKEVLLIEVPKGIHKPYQTLDGKFWIRVGSTNRIATKEELSRLFQQAGLVHFDLSPVEGTSNIDLDYQRLNDYWSGYYDIPFLALTETEQNKILNNADILVPFEGTSTVSVGGLLIFGKYPQKRLPQSSIVTAVFQGTNITDHLLDKKEVTGTLPELIDRTSSLVQLFIPKPSVIEGMKRKEEVLLPAKAVREILVNAVSHRDYSLSDRKISVYIFSNRVEITSPGKIPNTLTLEKIKVGNSALRNHFVVKYLDNLRYIDGLGRGIPLVIKTLGERVVFEEIGILFRVTLFFNQTESD
ncbi:MAG: histidine kinase [Proteobacteria bacterium]|nr:histidine kinase [Pseudomonadota bacterium]